MKYVMFEVDPAGTGLTRLEPVIFSNALVHAIVAEGVQRVMARHHWHARPVSAGTVEFDVGSAECSGRSETLNLESDAERDARVINSVDYAGNYL